MIEYLISALAGVSWSSAASIVFGAFISAVVSYSLQRSSFAEARRQKATDRFEAHKALAYGLFFKLIRIHSTIAILNKDLQEFVAKAKKEGSEFWQVVLPFGNLPDRIKFTPDEMALLLSLDAPLFNDIGPYDDIHNSLLDLFALYGTKRVQMTEQFGAKEMDGAKGITTVTKEQWEWIQPRAYELNELVKTMVGKAERDSKESRELLEKVHALFVKRFGLNPTLEFKDLS